MAKDNNTNPKKPKFSSWWIYGLVAVLLIGFQFFNSDNLASAEKTTTSELQEYLRNGDIEKILIITNTNQAKVFLTDEALAKDVHKGVTEKPFLPSTTKVPQYTLDYGDLQIFQNEITEIKKENNLDTIVEFGKESTAILDFLLSLLPFVLIIGIWIYLMRRMSGGGGGGAGGQIFNIGKSKAKFLMKKRIQEPHLKM